MLFHWTLRMRFHRYYEPAVIFTSGIGNICRSCSTELNMFGMTYTIYRDPLCRAKGSNLSIEGATLQPLRCLSIYMRHICNPFVLVVGIFLLKITTCCG